MSALQRIRPVVVRWLMSPRSRKLAAMASRVPVVGPSLRKVGEAVLPRDSRFWIQVESGPAKGVWMKLTARVGAPYRDGGPEPVVQEALVRILKPGMVFIDAGANMGFFSLLAARLVGPPGKVLSFEPDPDVRGWLGENVQRNGMTDTIAIHANAVWRATEELTFERADSSATPDRGTGHVSGNTAPHSRSVVVQGIALDTFCLDGTDSSLPDLIKVDVEGVELEVLKGAPRLLARGQTKWIVEIHDPSELQAVRNVFAAAGYDDAILEGEGKDTSLHFSFHLLAAPRGHS